MNDQIRQFFQALRSTDVATKLVVAVTAVALIGAIAIVGLVSKDPHFEVAFTGLSDAEFVRVSEALAAGGIDSRAIRGEGSNAISTHGSDVLRAQQLAYAAGAISHVTKGILGSSAEAGIFAGNDERLQLVREREMSEIEKIIETLDYITQAEVFLPKQSSNTLRGPVKNSISMVVRTRNGAPIGPEESDTLARTLANFMEVTLDKVVITDSKGRMVHGGASDDQGLIDGRFLDIQNNFNEREERRINTALAQLFGPNKARVTISSEFDFVQSTVQSHTSNGKPVELTSRSFNTETPIGAASANGGGIAGASSNVASGGAANGLPASVTGVGGLVDSKSTTTEKEVQNFLGTTNMVEIHNQPKLKRLSVSLAVDESLADREAAISENVKSMVGFDETRKDGFNAMVHPFVQPEAVAVGEDGEALPEELPPKSAFSLETLLENGVELISALAFIFLLFKGLKGNKAQSEEKTITVGGQTVSTASGASAKHVEIDPEALARAQVEDLVQNNPERVAQILSNWVVEDRSPVKNA